MPNYVLVDKSMDNKKIRVGISADYGDDVHVIDVVPREFRSLMAYYPILLTQDAASGQLLFAAILGFQAGENLFLGKDGWDAMYIPLNIRRRPFSVQPREAKNAEGQIVRVPAMCIDIDSARLNDESGESMFDAEGKPTVYFENAKQIMAALVEGTRASATLIEKLQSLDLIEPMKIGFEFVNGEKRSLNGLSGINESRFMALADDVVLDLHKQGYLSSIYAMLASMSQLGSLVNRRNNRLRAQPTN